MTSFSDILDATEAKSGRAVARQDDPNQIAIDLPDFEGDLGKSIAAIRRRYSWDASEMGITMEQAIQNLLDADTPEARQQVIEDLRRRALQRANLDTSTGKIAMLSVGQLPWHALGTRWEGPITIEQALIESGMANWGLQLEPNYVWVDGELIATGSYSVLRSDTKKVLTRRGVSEHYRIVSNEDTYAFMDAVMHNGVKIETAGSIGNGEQTWILARLAEPLDVAGDEMLSFAMISARNDGEGPIRCYPTNVRTVCANTKRVADNTATNLLTIPHRGDINDKITKAKEALGQSQQMLEDFANVGREMAGMKLEPEEYFAVVLDDVIRETIAGQRVTAAAIRGGNVLDAILEMPENQVSEREAERKRYERVLKRREKLFTSIMDRYESDRNNGNKRIAGTAWAAWNAVTEEQDHGRRYKGNEHERAENRFQSVLNGAADAVKENALWLAISMAT